MNATTSTFKLRAWRRAEGLTQREAAAKLGVARRTWLLWEQGAMIPGVASMAEIVTLTAGAVQPNDFYRMDQAA